LHLPIAKLTKFQKGVYYSGIKMFNNLPHNIKDLANETKLFRNALNRFLLINFSFYNSEEYFNFIGNLWYFYYYGLGFLLFTLFFYYGLGEYPIVGKLILEKLNWIHIPVVTYLYKVLLYNLCGLLTTTTVQLAGNMFL
jgi:hypothetical protein